ncbi:MAG: hypothetical protein E7667_03545 [Ruminococcaceae bacterium]|nr:hypothetical protein [Oscillospiraceae bacterium]
MESKIYDCARCANKRTPMCTACSVVTAPDGTQSKPKYFVRLSDEEIRVIGASEGNDLSADLALYIRTAVEKGVPIPLALVMIWNRQKETQQ